MKRYTLVHLVSLFSAISALGYWLVSPTISQALNSCSFSQPAAITAFSQGPLSDDSPIAPEESDPSILLEGSSSSSSQVALGIGGSVTVYFPTPIANYPSAGLPSITRPATDDPCSTAPVQAVVAGSLDGVSFTELGTLCDGGSISLGAFPWVSYIRITDSTDPSHPAFVGNPTSGFTLSAISGPTCLKRSLCADTATLDPVLAESTTSSTFSLGALGDDWVFADEASFEEYGNGSARLMGEIVRASIPEQVLTIVVSFTGRISSPPAGSPVRLLKPSSYIEQGGPIDPSLWYYYKTISGEFIGKGGLSGKRFTIQGAVDAAQVGAGADGRSAPLGAFLSFMYGSGAMQSEGFLAFKLPTCFGEQPTPTDSPTPSETPISINTPLPTNTPQISPTPGEKPIQDPRCSTDDKTVDLVALDKELIKRLELASKATRIVVRGNPSSANKSFRLRARSSVRNLVQKAWQTIWQHPWRIFSCQGSSLCTAKSLAPAQASIAAAVTSLDSVVSETLLKSLKRAKSAAERKRLRALRAQHTANSQLFEKMLRSLPVETYECSS